MLDKALIVMGHNDLDQLGCMLNLEFITPNIPKEYFHTNYADIPEVIQNILTFIKNNPQCTNILITDVSFSDNKEHLITLYETGLKITHIDHHLYPDGFWDIFPNMTVCYDKTKSASLLCNNFLKCTGKNEKLDKLTRFIDVYDLWQTEEVEFDISQDINEYFWYKIKVQALSLKDLMNLIKSSSWQLPTDYIDVTKKIKETYTKDIADFEKNNAIQRSEDITLCFVSTWFNQILVPEMKKGKNFVIGLTSYGIIRIRIREAAPYTTEMKNTLRLALTGTENTGHMNAFTYKMHEAPSFDACLREAQKIYEQIRIAEKMNPFIPF